MGALLSAAFGGQNARAQAPHPLFTAVREGNLDAIRVLLQDGANINMRSRKGYTPLYEACKTMNAEVVSFLVDRGAIVPVEHAHMAMERVITADNIGITRMLFASGVTIASTEEPSFNAVSRFLGKGTERDSLLRLAIERKNEEMVKLLVQQGACIHVTDTGRSPLHYARNHKAIQSYLRRVVPQCDHSLGFTLFLTLVAFALVVLHALFATDT